MAGISKSMHSGVLALLALFAIVVVCGATQWIAPNQSVRPIAARFLCDGQQVDITPVAAQEGTAVLTQVQCESTGSTPDDVSLMAFLILTIPCGLILAAATMLVKRWLLPAPRTITRRAHA